MSADERLAIVDGCGAYWNADVKFEYLHRMARSCGQQSIWAALGLFHDNEEAMCLYLAQLVLLDVLLVAALMVLNDAPEPTRVAPGDRSLDGALGKAGEGASLLNGSALHENGACDCDPLEGPRVIQGCPL